VSRRARDALTLATESNWPALLVAAACTGLGLSNWFALALPIGLVLVFVGGAAIAVADGYARFAAFAAVLAVCGICWGTMRMEAFDRSDLIGEIGSSGSARLVTTGPARQSEWAVRVPAEVQVFRQRRLREHVLLALPVGRSPPRGAVLEADVKVAEPRPAENGFDERAWLARQGIHVVLKARSWRQIGRRGGLSGLGDRLRDHVEAAISRGTDGRHRGVVLGVVLGEDEGLGRGTQQEFRASGLYHLLAVSGQNVAFIALGMLALGWLLRLGRLERELLTLAAIAAYVLAVGWQPSVVRAAVAGALVSLAWIASRPRDRWHFLALGALVLLAWAPTSLLDPGFQLSFAAVGAIFVGLPVIHRMSEGYPVQRRAAEGVGVAVVCGVVTAPIVLLQFGQAPVYTVPANALAEPAMPIVLGLGLLAAVVDPVAPGAAAALAWLAGWGGAWLELVARTIAALPGAQIGPRGALVGALVAVALAALVRGSAGPRRALSIAPVALAAIVLVLALALAGWRSLHAPSWHPPAGLRVTFLDVGQGDSALLETASAKVLVDEGPPEADVAGQLLRMGIRSLSAIVLTHPERDHVGGAAAVLRRLQVGAVLDPELAATGPDYPEAMAAVRARHVPRRLVRGGAEFRIGGLLLKALSPPDAGLPSENPNFNAVVLIASYGDTDVFLPADAESDVTGHLAGLRDVEVLKVAHHGSEDPGLADELRVLRPEVAVISVGRGNDYGHPRPETLSALAAVPRLALYRTDVNGRVVVESDGRILRVHAAR
jgi:competence protein ComEC